MAGTRSSARLANNSSNGNSDGNGVPKSTEPKSSPRTGSKRKADTSDSPKGKRGPKAQKQQTIEDVVPKVHDGGPVKQDEKDDQAQKLNKDEPTDIEMLEAAEEGEGTDKLPGQQDQSKDEKAPEARPDIDVKAKESSKEIAEKADEATANNRDEKADAEDIAIDQQVKANEEAKTKEETRQNQDKPAEGADKPSEVGKQGDAATLNAKTEEKTKDDAISNDANGSGIEKDSERAKKMPSNILEKGLIYFVTRGRVGIENPESPQDLQRTHIVLRPIPDGAKIGEGAIEDDKKARLIAIPKKVLPKSGRDQFMVFVEKAGASMKDLKDEFFGGSEYNTKTMGVRSAPPVAPIGEGVYALTTTGNTSHLVYMLTIPQELSEVQKDLGLREKGSFITSLKNPTVKGPAYATLQEKPDFPQEYIDNFGARSWMPVMKSEYMDYPNAQFLLIGASEDKFDNALQPSEKDQKEGKEEPIEELEKLEDEDQIRIEHLDGDDSVYQDLGISKKDFPDVMTTW